MGFALNIFNKTKNLDLTIQLYLIGGVAWLGIGAIFSVLTHVAMFSGPLVPGVLDYGHLRPAFLLAGILGGVLSVFFGVAYFALKRLTGSDPLLAPLAFVGFKLHQTAVLLGVLAVLLGFSKGRELGEMPWLADALFAHAPIFFLIVVIVALKQSGKQSIGLTMALATACGGLVVYLLGNVNLPYGPLQSASFFRGFQDGTLQEIYRVGVVVYFLTLPALTILYILIPLYYKVELYSERIAHIVLFAAIVLVPLAGPVGLVHSAAPALLQTIGVFASMALFFALLGGALNCSLTIKQSGKSYRSDALGLGMRWAAFFVGTMALARALLSPRFVQAVFGYTWFDIRTVENDLLSFGVLIAAVGAVVAFQLLKKQSLAKGLVPLLVFLIISGGVITILANLADAAIFSTALSSVDSEGALSVGEWSAALFSSNVLEQGASGVTATYLLSLRGLAFVGSAAIALALTVLCVLFHFRAVVSGPAYEEPELIQKEAA